MAEIKNAIVLSADIFVEDHGLLTSFLTLDYGDGGQQGFGGYVLLAPRAEDPLRSNCGLWVWRVLHVAGVERWSQLPGRVVRVEVDDHVGIEAIGHAVRDVWFRPRAEFGP